MDVLLLNTSPEANKTLMRYIGPYKIAHWIRKHGYSCQVIDFVSLLTYSQILQALKKFVTPSTTVIGVSTTFMATTTYEWEDTIRKRMPEQFYKALKQIKNQYPHIKFVVGGYVSERLHSFGIFDATIMSYTEASEDIFLEYVDHYKKGTPLPFGTLHFPEFSKTFSDKPRMVYNKARNPKYNIETDDFKFVKQDIILKREALPLDVSRGCIFACKFCQYPHLGKGKLDYIRGMNYLEEELRSNYEKFGTTRYYMLDDTFNDTEWKMSEFYKMTQRLPFKLEYFAYLRADLIYRFPDTAHMLKESGLWGAYHGLESLHPGASKAVGKAWSGKHARDYIPELYHNIWKHEVPMHLNFIIGLPGETKEDILSTVDWYKENKLGSIWFNSLGLYGPDNTDTNWSLQSEFDRNAEKYGYTFEEGVPSLWNNKGWKTEQFTEEEAWDLHIEINRSLNTISPIGTWFTLALRSYNFSQEFLMSTSIADLPWPAIIELTRTKVEMYFDQLMKS